jgi:hypothetical protein
LIGLSLKPNINSNRTFRILANSATTIKTDPADGKLTDVAALGSGYNAELSQAV